MAQLSAPHMQVPFVDLAAEYQTCDSEIADAVLGVLRRADFILGRDVELLEKEFAIFCESEYAVGVDSGLSALELILRAYGIGAGHEVITAANTFIASALAISATGATPILVDVNPTTYTIDVCAIENAITKRTAAIMPVHLYGHPAEMDEINEIARRNGIPVIEDGCQAHGARYRGRRTGSLGDSAAFSFYPSKNLGACGDGGMVVTNDAKINQYVRTARNYGQREKYHHAIRGYNHRLDSLQAAVLRTKLPHLDARNSARRECARRYQESLSGTDVVLPHESSYVDPVWHLFVVRVKHRPALQKHLSDRGIATGIHYPIPIHLQEAYADLGYGAGQFPVTEGYAREILSLPMYPELRPEMVDYVSTAIRDFQATARFEGAHSL